jgi:hypothetical protein
MKNWHEVTALHFGTYKAKLNTKKAKKENKYICTFQKLKCLFIFNIKHRVLNTCVTEF